MNAKSKKSLLVFALLSLVSSFVCAKQDNVGDLLVEKGLISQDELDNVQGGAASAQRSKSLRLRGEARVQYTANFPKEPNLSSEEVGTQDEAKFRVQAFALRSVWDLGSGFSAHFDMGVAGDNARIERPGAHGIRVLTAYGRYSHSEYLNIDAGFRGVPFGYEEGLSTNHIKTLGRTPANVFFDNTLDMGNRNTGLFIHGNVVEGLYYQGAITNPLVDDLKGRTTTLGADKVVSSYRAAFWGQLGYKGSFEALEYNVGGSLAYVPNQKLSIENPAFEAHQFGWNLFANMKWERLEFMADFYASRVEDAITAGETEMPWAFSLVPSYKITDEVEIVGAVSYINAKQVPQDRFRNRAEPNPNTPLISPSSVLTGADGGDQRFNKMISWYAGLNYFPIENVKITGGYQYSEFKERDLSQIETDNTKRRHHGVGAQLQLVF